MRGRHTLLSMTGLAFIAFSMSAHAEPLQKNLHVGPYVGVSVGVGGIEPESIGLAEVGDAKTGSAGALKAGWWFNEHWGAELSYMKHGVSSQEYTNGTFRARGESVAVGLMGRLPFAERWDLVGKLSIMSSRLRDAGSTTNINEFGELRGRSTSLVISGVEVGYRFSPSMRAMLELDSRGSAGERSSIGYAGIGLQMNF